MADEPFFYGLAPYLGWSPVSNILHGLDDFTLAYAKPVQNGPPFLVFGVNSRHLKTWIGDGQGEVQGDASFCAPKKVLWEEEVAQTLSTHQ